MAATHPHVLPRQDVRLVWCGSGHGLRPLPDGGLNRAEDRRTGSRGRVGVELIKCADRFPAACPMSLTATPTKPSPADQAGWLRGAGAALIDLAFPPRCAACWRPLDSGRQPMLCEGCRTSLWADAVERCPLCAAEETGELAGEFCVHCYGKELRFDAATALGGYKDQLREAVLRTKHPRHEPLAQALAELVWQRCAEQLRAWRIDVVAPIPMHWRRRLSRGVNCPHVLAEALAHRLGVPHLGRALRRRRATREQFHLEQDERRRNVRGAMVVRRPHRWTGRRVLLVDDILTTGATCSEAARMLKRAGAGWVAVAVVARAQHRVE